jgi:hypothetical protein
MSLLSGFSASRVQGKPMLRKTLGFILAKIASSRQVSTAAQMENMATENPLV